MHAPSLTAAALLLLGMVLSPASAQRVQQQQTVRVWAPTYLTPCQKSIIQQATNLYENDQRDFDYAYCENIKDGRGYTAGIAGFCTGTHDAYKVITAYMATSGNGGEFAPYLGKLAELDKKSGISGSTKGLSGYCAAWARASENPVFRAAQRQALDDLYFQPSQRLADKLGLSLPLARGQLYDAAIQHGLDDSAEDVDPDSLNALITRATTKVGGSPAADGIAGHAWLAAFLEERARTLCHPANEDTQKEWCASVGRVRSYQHALQHTKFGQFQQELEVLNNDGKAVTLTCEGEL